MSRHILSVAAVFDGVMLRQNQAVVIDGETIAAILPESEAPAGPRTRLQEGTLSPGFVDLQVNGGAGLMVDGATNVATLQSICEAHLRLGSAGILPTLITDTPDTTAGVIAAGLAAARERIPGFLGLHLEGPHLDLRRKGAHDPALIRPMTDADLELYCDSARNLPALMLTIAPESVTPEQISTLAEAGVIVSLGHSDCSFEVAKAAIAAGARCFTHLFNAMSPLGNREPGMVGAALESGVCAGLIADGIHVHPSVMRFAVAARPKGLFLVSDCMAFAGSDLTEITLNNRAIHRRDGRLSLTDGTLAGADLTLPQAVKVMIERVGLSPVDALTMATSIPAGLIGAGNSHGHLRVGCEANLVHLDADWRLASVWHRGELLPENRTVTEATI